MMHGHTYIKHISILQRFVDKHQVALKSNKHNVYFICTPMHIYNNSSLNSF